MLIKIGYAYNMANNDIELLYRVKDGQIKKKHFETPKTSHKIH